MRNGGIALTFVGAGAYYYRERYWLHRQKMRGITTITLIIVMSARSVKL